MSADERVKADLGTVALRYGPLVYNVETQDNADIGKELSSAPLKMEWRPDLLGGVMVMTGTWKDGTPMVAVPNYARMNRIGRPPEYPADDEINYAPGATTTTGIATPSGAAKTATSPTPAIVVPKAGVGDITPVGQFPNSRSSVIESKVWI